MLPQSEYIRRNPDEFPVQYSLTAAAFLEKPAKKKNGLKTRNNISIT